MTGHDPRAAEIHRKGTTMKKKLLDGWEWMKHQGSGSHAACLMTHDQDCFVWMERGSVNISTGVAPWEIVSAVIAANKKSTP
jgi:hypothetical protein